MERVVYQPPKTVSYGQAPRVRGLRQGWELARTFLEEHTVPGAPRIRLWTLETNPVTSAAAAVFGAPPNGPEWQLGPERLDEALAFAFDKRQHGLPIGAFLLSLWYDFSWRNMPNPEPGHPSPARDNTLGILFHPRSIQLQPTFQFAAPSHDQDFLMRLRQLETTFPFKPKDAYYYRVLPKKSGPGERMIRLGEGWKGSS
jgi:hypothetical protein